MKSKIIVLFFILICQFNYGQTKKHYKYDVLNRLIAVSYNETVISYIYDELGNRKTKTIIKNNTAIPKVLDENLFVVIPNPVKTFLKIKSTQDIQQGNYSIYNMDGKILLEGTVTSCEMKVNVSSFSKGSYIILLSSEKKYTSKVFIKE